MRVRVRVRVRVGVGVRLRVRVRVSLTWSKVRLEILSWSDGSLVCVVICSCHRSCQTETDQRVPSGSATGASIRVPVSAMRWHLQFASSWAAALGMTDAPLGGGGGRGHCPCAHCHSRSSRLSLANSSISSVPGRVRRVCVVCEWCVARAWRVLGVVCMAACAWCTHGASTRTACGEGNGATPVDCGGSRDAFSATRGCATKGGEGCGGGRGAAHRCGPCRSERAGSPRAAGSCRGRAPGGAEVRIARITKGRRRHGGAEMRGAARGAACACSALRSSP